jgi:hypothetical protein
VVGLACLIGVFAGQQTSTRGLGKGDGHAGSSRYKNRSSRHRGDKPRSP